MLPARKAALIDWHLLTLTERLLDVLLSRVDFRQELLEELEASPEPQQSLGGRVAHLRDLRLHFVQHDGLQRGVDVGVGFQLLVDFLQRRNNRVCYTVTRPDFCTKTAKLCPPKMSQNYINKKRKRMKLKTNSFLLPSAFSWILVLLRFILWCYCFYQENIKYVLHWLFHKHIPWYFQQNPF